MEKGGQFYGAVTVSKRGQIVIPTHARRDLNIEVGEKLLVVSVPGGGVLLVRANVVDQMLNQWMDLFRWLNEESRSEMSEGTDTEQV